MYIDLRTRRVPKRKDIMFFLNSKEKCEKIRISAKNILAILARRMRRPAASAKSCPAGQLSWRRGHTLGVVAGEEAIPRRRRKSCSRARACYIRHWTLWQTGGSCSLFPSHSAAAIRSLRRALEGLESGMSFSLSIVCDYRTTCFFPPFIYIPRARGEQRCPCRL